MGFRICKKAVVSGRVQGVFFRASTQRHAQKLNIAGHAINLDSGRVEVIMCGEEEAINELLEWLELGPPLARVDDVELFDLPMLDVVSFSTG